MDFRKFLHDIRTNTNHYTTAEAAVFLDLECGRVRYLVKVGILVPVERGGRGRSFYFKRESLEDINKLLEPYR